jgi:hypothetical protein
VNPATLLPRGAELFLKRLPEPERAVSDGQFRRGPRGLWP